MKEKILAFLTTRLVGVSKAYLEGVAENYSKTITEESQIETIINDGVIAVLKHSADYVQSESDRRATDATQTAVANYEKKHNLKDGKPAEGGGTPPNPPKPPEVDDKTPEWAKALIQSNEALTQKIEVLEKDKATQTKAEKQAAALKGSKVLPEHLQKKWANRIDPDGETAIEDQVKELEEEFTETHKSIIGESSGKGLPLGGKIEGEASEEDVEEIASKL